VAPDATVGGKALPSCTIPLIPKPEIHVSCACRWRACAVHSYCCDCCLIQPGLRRKQYAHVPQACSCVSPVLLHPKLLWILTQMRVGKHFHLVKNNISIINFNCIPPPQFFFSGCPKQETGWAFIFKGLIIGTCYHSGIQVTLHYMFLLGCGFRDLKKNSALLYQRTRAVQHGVENNATAGGKTFPSSNKSVF
jgi:hypothetical protein